jgi:hypothetical protein
MNGPPRAEPRSKVEQARGLRNERVEDVRQKLHRRRTLWVVRREGQTELEDRIGVVA